MTLLLLLFLSNSCKKEKSNLVTVEIKIEPGVYDSLGYYLSRNQIVAYSLWNFRRAYFDSTGYLRLNMENNNINWFFISFSTKDLDDSYEDPMFSYKSRVYLLVRPGESYKITYDPDSVSLFTIEGDYNEGQKFYNNFQILRPTPFNMDVTNTKQLFTDLEDTIKKSLAPLKELYKEKRIDRTFFNAAKAQVEYHFAWLVLTGLKFRYSYYKNSELKPPEKMIPVNVLEEKYFKLIGAIFSMYPYDSKYAPMFSDYGSYLNDYIWFKTLKDTAFNNRDKLKKVEFAKNLFNKELHEYYFAHQFCSFSLKEGPEMAAMRYKAFLEQYPNSLFIPGIDRLLLFASGFLSEMYPVSDRDKKDNENSNTQSSFIMSTDVNIIDGKSDITSLDTLLTMFKGKNIFIDNWASWCMPCRGEFDYADTLYKFLQKHNYVMLFISSDKDEDKWLGTIQLYNLKGYHYRIANPELRKENLKLAPAIPRYMIVDKKGKIVEYDAKFPSSGEELYEQLLQYVK